MPEYAGFSIALASQYDAATIPESHVRVFGTPTYLDRIATESPGLSVQHPDKTFQDRGNRGEGPVVEVYVPVWAGSQFWVCYACPPPVAVDDPRDDEEDEEQVGMGGKAEEDEDRDEQVKYYYFKLYMSGRCILSWGVGEKGKWRGKTMFGFFNGGSDFEGRRIVEKRGLFFPNVVGRGADDDNGFEIRIFRAKARRREFVEYQGSSEVVGGGGRGVCLLDLTSIGKVQRGERQRFYSYALIDAKDEPWVTFRYKFEPGEDDNTQDESTFLSAETGGTTSVQTCQTLRSKYRM